MNTLEREAAQTQWFYGQLHLGKCARQFLGRRWQLMEAIWN